MRIKVPVDPSGQSSVIYRAQCKDCSSNCTVQILRKLATRIEDHLAAIKNSNVKTSHCVDIGHNFDLAETKILSRTNSWAARIFKEA